MKAITETMALILCLTLSAGTAFAEASRPNIVLFLADDLGWADVPWHGSPYKLPHLDKLAREGVKLEAHYVHPMCSPTRAALMTGRYASRFGVTAAQNQRALPWDTVTLARALKSAGYETALIGKWHLGSKPEEGPQKYGFDHGYGSLAGGCGPYDHRYKEGEFSHTWHRNGRLVEEEGHVTDLIAREAARWLAQRAEKPFFLYLPFTATHVPIREPEQWLQANAHLPDPAQRLRAACTTHMDDAIGRVLTELDRKQLRANTLVIFLSDNGAHAPNDNQGGAYPGEYERLQVGNDNRPLRGHKSGVYEGGIRTPGVAHWPGQLQPAATHTPLHAVDWMPTLCKLAGAGVPGDPKWDGMDIWPVLKQPSQAWPARSLYSAAPGFRAQMLRHGDWKLVVHHAAADPKAKKQAALSEELFHLARDASESKNLAADEPGKLAEMKRRLMEISARDKDSMVAALSVTSQASALWGQNGEKWSPESRLPDFSFAGYRRGEEPFRIPKGTISVASFGGKGDGRTDDTAAFKQAITAGAGTVVTIPPGRFVLSDVLEIRRSNLVLRGAGSDKTVLLFTKPLEELRPRPAKTDGNQPTSGWSWGGGLIMIGGKESSPARVARVAAAAKRGARQLSLERPAFKAGDEVVLTVQDDKDKTLVDYLYRGQGGNVTGLNNWKSRQIFRVTAVSGNTITLDRALRFDARPEWQPTLQIFQPAVTDVGIEGIAFEFPATPYAGHFRELGFNPVVIESTAAHCWLRDLRVWNGDSGPYVNGAFCTVDGIHLGADAQRKHAQGHTGHHGITLQGLDCLCTNFTIETQFIHDLTVQSAIGCVFCSGRALNLNMDHHRWAPYENLFADIDAGEGTRLFSSSGGGHRGAHTAAGATFWNIRTRQPAPRPTSLGIDAINLVGVKLREAKDRLPTNLWYEAISPGQVTPTNLHSAMLRRRLASPDFASIPVSR